MNSLSPRHLISKKRDGQTLSPAEIRTFIAGVTDGSIPDYQVSAMLMAIFWRGLDDGELAVWADAMIHSGDVLDLSDIAAPKVDKHSTGGVGDKISLCLAPAVAACGVAVPMISGRGLGFSGGTLDKLEGIPGFRVDLDAAQLIAVVADIGTCLVGQTDRLAPADRRLYALRDVTATVESIPLIASSIMSKKLAAGIDALVLDCKVGRGAFMKTIDEARRLGTAIRAIGRAAGKAVMVFFTDMDTPIGTAVGHNSELVEAMAVLSGGGPADTRELTVRLGAEMLRLGGIVADEADGIARLEAALTSGAGLDRLRRVIAAQSGDVAAVDDPARVLPVASATVDVTASTSGYINAVDAAAIGFALIALGGGRQRTEDSIDHTVGIDIIARVGDRVTAGQTLARIYHRDRGLDDARAQVATAFVLQDEPVTPLGSRIIEVMR